MRKKPALPAGESGLLAQEPAQTLRGGACIFTGNSVYYRKRGKGMRDEGRDVRRFLPDVERIEKTPWSPEIEKEALELGEEMAAQPVAADYPYEEPSELSTVLLYQSHACSFWPRLR